jgi:hypothetical protein
MKINGEYRLEDATELFERKGVDELQSCFDYMIFCLARDQYLSSSFTSDTLLTVVSESIHSIQSYFSELLTKKMPKREKAITNFLELLPALANTEQEEHKKTFLTLVKNSACLRKNKETLQVILPS